MLSLKIFLPLMVLLISTSVMSKPQFGNPIREDDDYLDYNYNAVPQKAENEAYPGNPYNFDHGVKDDKTGNDYSHKEASDGEITKGEYRVVLPDGRLQIVKYQADRAHGFTAEIIYENITTEPTPVESE